MVEKVLVLQSFAPPPWPEWRALCHSTVRSWAKQQGYSYRLLGDELFDPIPNAARHGCRGVLLPLTDLGRLIWMRDLLTKGWSRVIWLDSDILIFDPSFRVDGDGVAREVWLSRGLKEGFRAGESVNNCGLSFSAGSQDLARCLEASLSAAMAFQAPPHPRTLGPDLFRKLHKTHPFPIIPNLAMIAPLMMTALATGDDGPMRAHHSEWCGPVQAANLCGSMVDDAGLALSAANALLADPAIMTPPGPAPVVERIQFS